MEQEFWQARWQNNEIAFHEPKPHDFLKLHFDALDLRAGETVLVPLCGKSLDVDWLLAKGMRVIGVELNQEAVEEVFDRLNLVSERSELGPLTQYEAGGLCIYQGDFFAVRKEWLGKVHAVFDRAALVALPDEMRARYAAHLAALTENAPQLVVTYCYEQSQTAGPPFSVPEAAVEELYHDFCRCFKIDSRPIAEPLAKRCSGKEDAILLVPR